MVKKTTKGITPSALALTTSTESANTQADFKVTKADMIGIISTNIIDSLEEEQKEINKQLSIIRDKLDIKLKQVAEKELKYVLTVKDFNLNYENTTVIARIEDSRLKIDVDSPGRYHKIRLNSSRIVCQRTVNMYTHQFSCTYYTVIPADIKPLVKELTSAQDQQLEIKNRLVKALNSKYINAQLNMSLLAGLKDGKEIIKNLGNMIEGLKDTIFAKEEIKQIK